MNEMQRTAAEMYAVGAISAEQVEEQCATPEEYKECMEYAEEYYRKYEAYMNGLEKAVQYKLEDEYNHCISMGMSPEEALKEWDIS